MSDPRPVFEILLLTAAVLCACGAVIVQICHWCGWIKDSGDDSHE